MKKLLLFIAAALLYGAAAPAQHMFDYRDIRAGKFAQKSVGGLRSMTDGEHYTILDGGRIEKYSYKTGNLVQTLFDPEHAPQPPAVRSYELSPDEKKILLTTDIVPVYRHSRLANYYVYDIESGELAEVAVIQGEHIKVKEAGFTPDGKRVVYVHDNDLFAQDISTGQLERITADGMYNRIINGHTDWVYEEEFGFTRAWSVSPDGRWLAYLRFDETDVPEYTILNYTGPLSPADKYPGHFTFKYPRAGDANSIVSLHVYDFTTGEVLEAAIAEQTEFYIPRLGWNPDGELWFYVSNRLQNDFQLMLADPVNGNTRTIYREQDTRYVERLDDETVTFLPGRRFIVRSESSGYAHLYMHQQDKGLTDTITWGNWEVTSVVAVTGDRVYYLSTEDSPLRRSLYSVKFNGKGKTKLTDEDGYYSIYPSNGFRYFISYFSNVSTPNRVTLHDSRGKVIRVLEDNAQLKERLQRIKVPRKEFFTFTTERGTLLNGYMIKPAGFDPSRKYPVLFTQYSGPGSQQVLDRWSMDWTDVMVQEGYLVVCVDGRGTGGRGAAFRKSTYGRLGQLETEDQISAARYVATLPFVDMNRIGIYGWSYGGFMALNCILKGNDVFSTAIAVAPVTTWRLYDTIYTEIYNGIPQDNPSGYDDNSPVNFAERLKGNLLIIHGSADDNVHPDNTFRMVQEFVRHDKQFDLMIYPDDNHSMWPHGRHHVMQKMIDYTLEKL